MGVFWDKGYEASSVRCLLEAMSINRGSLYDTFGDKRSLFTEAIEHYRERVLAPFFGILERGASPLRSIRLFLNSISELTGKVGFRGCLVTNTALEVAPHDEEVSHQVCAIISELKEAFLGALNRAVAVGELPSSANTQALARFLTTIAQGLVVMHKADPQGQSVADTIEVAIQALGHNNSQAGVTSRRF